MPFSIIRDNIVHVKADAIVNTANPNPVVGSGTDSAIHEAAGPRLLAARQKIGPIAVGQAALTKGYRLKAHYVIHTVGPVWRGGDFGEAEALQQCYANSLRLALDHGCESIAFPLISTGAYGFPKALALQIAIQTFSAFLTEHEMQITLVVFHREAYQLSTQLFDSVSSFIDDAYAEATARREYRFGRDRDPIRFGRMSMPTTASLNQPPVPTANEELGETVSLHMAPAAPAAVESLNDLLRELDAGFSEALLKLIDQSGKKDAEIYKKANIDRKLFSKIRSKPNYKPSKPTAIALAVALELDFDQTQQLIGRAGYTLSRSSKFDIIIEFFLRNHNYDIFEINATLFQFDQSLLGAS